MKLTNYKADLILILHFALGLVVGQFPILAFYWVYGVFVLGLIAAYNQSTKYPSYIFAAYLTGIELLGRMSASGLPHEFIKYAVSVILIVSLFRKRKQLTRAFVLFLIVLFPAVFLTDGGSFEESRQLISANLSGPFCLAISVFYFYKRPFNAIAFRRIAIAILFPLASILGYLVVKTPDFSEIEFGFQSNFATSVYGPNQMSSILGLGVLVIGLCYFLKIRLFKSNLVVLSFMGFLLFRGLLTFSRGGMLTPLILLVIIFLYFSWKVAGFNKNTVRIILLTAVFAGMAFVLFNYANQLTGNKLLDRYSGVKGGKQVENIDQLTSGRTQIVLLDWLIFMDNPLFGIGVGMGKYARVQYGYMIEVAAHNEFSRTLAEHGAFGVLALLILVGFPIHYFFKNNAIGERIIIIAFIGFCFVFMTHAATRIAAPCFLYGFAFIKIVQSSKKRKNGIVLRQHVVTPRQVTSSYGVGSAQVG